MTKKLLTYFLFVFLLTVTVCATTDGINDYAQSITNGSFVNDSSFAANASDTASEALKPQNIFLFMLESIKNTFTGSQSNFFLLLVIIIISALVEVFNNSLGSYSTLIDYVSLLALMLVCFEMITPLIASVTSFLNKHTAFMMSLASSSNVLLAASGSAGSAAVSSVSSAFITAFTEICSINIILPAVKIIIVLSSVTAISTTTDLSGVIGFLKNFCTYGIGLLFSVFLAVHSLTVSISSNADSLAFRSLRFTAARLIPVAGSMISESIKTVLAGMNMIKSASGGIGIAYIIYTAIPSVIAVLSTKTLILITMLISKIFGVRKQTAFLEGLNSAFNLLLAVCIFASFGGIIILAVFINTAVNA